MEEYAASYEERKRAIYEVLKRMREYPGNGVEALGEHSYQGLQWKLKREKADRDAGNE